MRLRYWYKLIHCHKLNRKAITVTKDTVARLSIINLLGAQKMKRIDRTNSKETEYVYRTICFYLKKSYLMRYPNFLQTMTSSNYCQLRAPFSRDTLLESYRSRKFKDRHQHLKYQLEKEDQSATLKNLCL